MAQSYSMQLEWQETRPDMRQYEWMSSTSKRLPQQLIRIHNCIACRFIIAIFIKGILIHVSYENILWLNWTCVCRFVEWMEMMALLVFIRMMMMMYIWLELCSNVPVHELHWGDGYDLMFNVYGAAFVGAFCQTVDNSLPNGWEYPSLAATSVYHLSQKSTSSI